MKKTNVLFALLLLVAAASCKKKDVVNSYQIIPEETQIKWKGFLKTGYFNEGTIGIGKHEIRMDQNKIVKASFVMPLSTLVNINLPDELKNQLIHHLQSADFFNMVMHPDITFQFDRVLPYKGDDPDAQPGANALIRGSLTILGKPLTITFPAAIVTKDDGLAIKAKIKVDRTLWGMSYGTGSELPDDQHILPEIQIELNLKAKKE